MKTPALPAASLPQEQGRILVHDKFQAQYFLICVWTGLVMIGVSILVYIAVRLYADMNNELPPQIMPTLIGIITFILMFNGVIGFITLRMSKKVAEATIAMKRSIMRIKEGRLTEAVQVRKGDYLGKLATSLDDLRTDLIRQETQLKALRDMILQIRETAPAGATLAIDQALVRIEDLLDRKHTDKKGRSRTWGKALHRPKGT